MSKAVRNYQASLFGREERSDCTVVFTLSEDQADRPSKRQKPESDEQEIEAADALAAPLPGHTLLLCPGSSYFAAQADRWSSQASGSSGSSGKPELRVPLGCAGDRPHAEAAIRFIYTNKLGLGNPVELLHVRRLAAFLGVEGCVEACDAAVLAFAKAAGAAPLEAVGHLYACRQLLPQWDDDPAGLSLLDEVMDECRAQLAGYTGADTAVQLPDGASVTLSKLLVWAFPDAPFVLNDPVARTYMLALPSASLKLLLSSHEFATDNEASVLLLLAEWLDAKPGTTEDDRQQLCHLVRLCHLSSPYLHGILPLLPWFPVEPLDIRCIQQCAVMRQEERDRYFMAMSNGGRPARIANWYVTPARPKPRSDVCRTHEWAIKQEHLEEALAQAEAKPNGLFIDTELGGSAGLVARGLKWGLAVRVSYFAYTFGVQLTCSLPSALKLNNPDEVYAHACPGPCRLTVWRWGPDGDRSAAHQRDFGAPGDLVQTDGNHGLGSIMAVRLDPSAAGAGAQDEEDAPLPSAPALWAPYLHAGKLSGSVEWLA
ncbi:hypothetical protein HYH03_000523 [Edaphochlamys debaryana]|uniref:BACK domain-containing protein n=1 Tax=Edaphochlamys debaryana TaxID=47281 RepID=A0A836C7H8_9CHLO|nr:hypothetical protein HYH03_000523 [Edaphochlamys debaryana]|eukprot:KAG2502029.1 hypothetical protein HYH03_000523 [Edaphochlamys debaryana]